MKNIFILIFLFILIMTKTPNVFAAENSAGGSAVLLKVVAEKESDSRAKILKNFLSLYSSPMATNALDFVEIADKYGLDWKLVAAISGVESTFGQQIPSESFNGWGWGMYGDNVIRFSSWKEGIETVSQGLRTKYIDKLGTQDVYKIGQLYAASPTWASRVIYFMNSIDQFKDQKLSQSLSLSL